MFRKRKKSPVIPGLISLISALVLAVYALYTNQGETEQPNVLPSSSTTYRVVKVIDGDTIVLDNREKVRYIGINAPEITKRDCFGNEAKKKNESLVLHKEVLLEKDVSERDKYNRLLRYVYLTDGTFVNKTLVQEGYAYASSYPPDISRQEELLEAQREAKRNKKGLWGACPQSR